MDPLTLGLILSLSSAVVLVTLFLLIKQRLARRQPQQLDFHAADSIVLSEHNDSIARLVVKGGGRLVSMNAEAQRWFNLYEKDSLSLERIAAKIRPREAFFALCAEEGETRLALDGRLIQANSSQLYLGDQVITLLTLQPYRAQNEVPSTTGLPEHAWEIFRNLSEHVGQQNDSKDVVLKLLESIEFLLPADKIELSVLDETDSSLVPYQLSGLPGDLERVIEHERQSLKSPGLAGYVYQRRVAVLAENFEAILELQKNGNSLGDVDEYRSLIGVPLKTGKSVFGTLHFLSRVDDTFQAEDLDIVNLVATQMSFILYDFKLRQKEEQRAVELNKLLALTRGFTELFETRNVFASLLKMLTALIPVEVLGFLIYDEKKQVLEGKNPFQGLPPQFIDLYFSRIPPNSEAEKTLLLQKVIITENAAESQQWETLGLIHLSQAASLQETALIPLVSGGRMLGYLQASNHSAGMRPFSENELNLLTLAAAQAAPIIENNALVQENVKHTKHTASLRRIANLASSASEVEDIIRLTLRELSVSFNADISLMFLLDESSASLEMHPSSVYGKLNSPPDYERLLMGDAQFPFSVSGSLNTRLSINCSRDNSLIPYYQDLLSRWEIESVVIAPLIVRDEGIGEIWIGSQKLSQYNQSDAQFLSSAAIQMASLIENTRLMLETDEDIRRRLEHFSMLKRIGFELNTSTDLNYLLQIIFQEIIQITGADRGMILIQELLAGANADAFSIHSLSGETRQEALTPFELDILKSGKADILGDADLEKIWLPDKNIRAALLMPIRCQRVSAGLIALYSTQDANFDDSMLEIVQALAVYAGVAIGNEQQKSQLAQHSDLLVRRIKTYEQLHQALQTIQTSKPLKDNLEGLVKAITLVTPFQAVWVSGIDPQTQKLTQFCAHGLSELEYREMEGQTNTWKDVETLLQPEFMIQSAYFIPAEQHIERPTGLGSLQLNEIELHPANPDAWKPRDILLIPLSSGSGAPLGLIRVDRPSNGLRPDLTTIEALSAFGVQAGLILENHHQLDAQLQNLTHLETMRNRMRWDLDEARQEVERVQSVADVYAAELQCLERKAIWSNAIPEIISSINHLTSLEDYLQALAQKLSDRFDFNAAVVARRGPSGPQLITMFGEIQKNANIEALLGQQNPISQVFQDGNILIVRDVAEQPVWMDNPLLNALAAVGLATIPLKVGERVQYALLLSASHPIADIEPALDQVASLARLVEYGLQNLQNLESTNTRLAEVNTLLEFNNKLENLDPQDIFHNLVQTVTQIIPAAETAWVGLWDEKAKQLTPVTSIGFSAAEHLSNLRFMEDFHNEKIPESELSLPLRVCRRGGSLRASEVRFAQDYRLTPADLIHYQRATGGRLPLSSLLTVLKRSDRTLGVLVIDHFSGIEEFSAQDETLASALTQQAVLALENARLFIESEKRSAQLQALTDSTGKIASTIRTGEWKDMFLQQVHSILPFDTATLWLREGQGLSIASVEGFDDQESRIGLSVLIEDSILFQEMDRTRQPLFIGNVHLDERFPLLAQHENLSWLAIPLLAKDELVGVLALEKKESDYYSPDQIRAALTFTSQAALSLFNARLLEESNQRTLDLDQRSKRLAILNQLSGNLIASLDTDEILRGTIEHLRSALNVKRVAAVLLRKDHLVLAAEQPAQDKLPQRLAGAPLMDHLRQSLGVFITSNVETEKDLEPLLKTYFEPRQVKSILMIPLETSVKLHGWIWLQTEQVYRFTPAEIDLARTMGNQAAIAMQNAELFMETQRLTGDLEKVIAQRTKALQQEHLQTQTLLKMINQLSLSIEIDAVMEKTLAILNESLRSEQCLLLLSEDKSRFYSTGELLVGPDEQGAQVDGSPEQDMAAWVLEHRVALLVEDVTLDPRWTFDKDPGFRNVLAVPLILGEQILGTMFLLHRQPGEFTVEMIDYVSAAARQLSIAVNNAQLFTLARDQSDRLVGMLREQQIDSSRSFAILEAIADGVLVTDAENIITLFNASAEEILGVETNQVTGMPLQEFEGALKLQETSWFQTILSWAKTPHDIQEGENYAQQLNLDDGRILLVHLAPVVLGETFLGTVSILRDITREVMVDRLKSDFVANVSHELRTPLTSIKGYADLMLMGASGEMSAEQQKFMRVIRENTRRLNILVNDLLDISHIDAGQLALSFEPVDLISLSESVLKDIRRRSKQEEKPMAFEIETPDTLPMVNADPEKIRQVIMNLVSNGYHYTPSNGKVSLRISRNGSAVRLDVIDNGIGISMDSRERIFERFHRGDHPFVLATAGTGLGLAISKILVEMHGGKIWFESSGVSGEGSVFSFTLPLVFEG